MKKYFINYNGNQYPARKLNLCGTEYKGGCFDGVEVSTEELYTATAEGFKYGCDSEEFKSAEDALEHNPLFVPASFLESDPTDEEMVEYLIRNNYER